MASTSTTSGDSRQQVDNTDGRKVFQTAAKQGNVATVPGFPGTVQTQAPTGTLGSTPDEIAAPANDKTPRPQPVMQNHR